MNAQRQVDAAAATNFAAIDDAVLMPMLHTGAPDRFRAIGDRWGAMSTALRDHGDDIDAGFRRVRESWRGATADEFAIQIRAIVEAAAVMADSTEMLRDLTYSAADSLRTAQTLWPPPPGWVGPAAVSGPRPPQS